AVLHHPAYRRKYELNLKREFPRIPLYNNFQQWAAWGKRLLDLHVNYKTVAPYPLERKDVEIETKLGIDIDNLQRTTLKAYKEEVIDLLMRVCTVIVETIRIVGEMP